MRNIIFLACLIFLSEVANALPGEPEILSVDRKICLNVADILKCQQSIFFYNGRQYNKSNAHTDALLQYGAILKLIQQSELSLNESDLNVISDFGNSLRSLRKQDQQLKQLIVNCTPARLCILDSGITGSSDCAVLKILKNQYQALAPMMAYIESRAAEAR